MVEVSGPASDVPERVRVRLSLGHTGDQNLLVRVSPSAADEMRDLLEAEGVFDGGILEMSAGPDLMIYAASFASGLGGLAAVLRVFFHRNSDKSVEFSVGEFTATMTGYSAEEVESLVDKTLADLHRQQLEQDKEWRRVLGRDGDDAAE